MLRNSLPIGSIFLTCPGHTVHRILSIQTNFFFLNNNAKYTTAKALMKKTTTNTTNIEKESTTAVMYGSRHQQCGHWESAGLRASVFSYQCTRSSGKELWVQRRLPVSQCRGLFVCMWVFECVFQHSRNSTNLMLWLSHCGGAFVVMLCVPEIQNFSHRP